MKLSNYLNKDINNLDEAKDQFVVSGFVLAKGRRDILSISMSKKDAMKFKKNLESDLKLAIEKYRWVKDLKIEAK